MFEGNSFGKTIGLLHRSMDVSSLRAQVIADNIANADVPNFKRSEISFESSLKRALDSENYRPSLELATTNEGHIPLYRPIDWQSVEPRRSLDYLTTAKNNGNNVDAEEEFTLSLRNQLQYTLTAQAANFEFGQVNLILRNA
jgi:flagellar basal-body rod protein FlgB